jgi:uncharacterized repeat protein (TIGR01451 family)
MRRTSFFLFLTLAIVAAPIGRAESESRSVRISFSEDALRLVPADTDAPSWSWELSLSRHGRPDDLRPASPPTVRVADDEIELARPGHIERFRNGFSGIQHVIEILPAAERGVLFFDFRIAGSLTAKVSEDGRSVEFRNARAARVLVYEEIRGVDAEGRDVAMTWERLEGLRALGAELRLVVFGGDHAFPIRITGRLATSKLPAPGAPNASAETGTRTLAAPANDQCSGAEVIPGNGPFPLLSSAVDITDATVTGDPSLPSCQSNVSHSVWFSFTPVTSGDYTFSLCADAPTATTVDDTVLAIYSSSLGGGSCDGLVELPGGCDDDACGATGQQSVLNRVAMTEGITYRIVVFKFDPTAPAVGAGDIQLQIVQHPPSGPAPPNDLCGAAEVIPPAGPFPYTTLLTADVSGATTTGDPSPPSCQGSVSRSIWYSFTPAVGGRYTFSDCATAPTGTTVDDTAIAIYTGGCSALTEVPGGCDDDSCLGEAAQSVIDGIELTAGTTYRIGVWQYGATPPTIGNTAVQMKVSQLLGPPNDACGAAHPLSLDVPVAGTTVAAEDDTQLPAGSGCFVGVGQTASTAIGGDVAYRFTSPTDGRYSFRVTGFDASRNAVLYLASDCPSGAAPAIIAGCLGAANRNAAYPDEEVSCVPLSAGQAVYAYVDENASTSGGSFTIEVNRCDAEVEPNGSPSDSGEPACGLEGSISPAGDADFFALGVPASGSKIFAMVDGASGNSTDFDLRVTTEADTLEYDDLNNDAAFGTVAPNASGTPVNGSASYLRVSHYNATAQAEPYRLYASVQPPAAGATVEAEPNDTLATATGSPGEFYAGALASSTDVDVFSLSAAAGELVVIQLDSDPTRDNTPFNGSLALLGSDGLTLALVNDNGSTSSLASGAGNLAANAPTSPGEAMAYRVRSSGTYFAKVAWSGGTAGNYLLSIAHDCKVGPPTNLVVSQTDAPDPALPGQNVTYSVTVRNLGSHPASVVSLRDDLPSGSTLVSASSTQGTCTGSGPVICRLGDLGAGGAAGVTVILAPPNTSGPIINVARASMAVRESSPGDEGSSETTQVGPSDSDGDGVSDASDCAPSNSSVWAVPGDATGLRFTSGKSQLSWSAPSMPGGVAAQYDLLRSVAASDFSSSVCVAPNITTTSADDSSTPGAAYHYLVRSENVCGGNLGLGSGGTPRTGGSCP